MNWQWIIPPLMGAVIGWITNEIAVKMLFRPLRPKYLFGKKLPMTPGLIPKEQARLARSVGDMIQQELLAEDVLEQALLSSDMEAALLKEFRGILATQQNNPTAIGDLLPPEITDILQQGIASRLAERLKEKELADRAGTFLMGHIRSRMHGNLLFALAGDMAEGLTGKVSHFIQSTMEESADALASQLVTREGEKLLARTVGDGVALVMPYQQQLEEGFLRIYRRTVKEKLSGILAALNVSALVEQRINSYDPAFLERLITDLARKELKAIVWLGAILGFLLGLVNLLLTLL